ncbi:MAG: deoxyribodipyrimidine photo-lyase [Candidatus Promineifilaceae bacterium]
MTVKNGTAVWWIRRDLRLEDNQALSAALEKCEQVLPVFILDPILLDSPYVGPKRLAFLFAGLRKVDEELQARGGRLIVRRGNPLAQLKALLAETGAGAIFAERDYSPYARQRDDGVKSELPLELSEGVVVHRPGSVLKNDGEPYTVFTPFSKTWKKFSQPDRGSLLAAPTEVRTPEGIESLPIPTTPELGEEALFLPGSEEAQERVKAFVSGTEPAVYQYGRYRDFVDMDSTAKLSPYLRFGMVSARRVAVAAFQALAAAPDVDARKSAESWLNELIWREFFVHILYHFPQVRGQSFRQNLRHIPWNNDVDDFQAWCDGRTGYPIVDAPMRQLRQEGWMHNRVRMVVASFLVKDLLIDWGWGEKWFMQHLVDGDPAANNGGWQWTAGTGTDAAPYFRIFNPVRQGEKFDPDGRFVRRWIPELADVPDKLVHTPWKMSAAEEAAAGCIIGRDYPAPIIDHDFARKRTLAAFK